ncbi:MAG: hypothetical protein U0931_10695 [Vulcanimicrobiota bacterium]
MNLDVLGLFQSPPRLRGKRVAENPTLPVSARLKYPLSTHLYRVGLTCFLTLLGILSLDRPAPFLWLGAVVAVAALYWRGLSLCYGPEALELYWRLHKLARVCWTQLFLIDVSQRGLLTLCEKDRILMTVDPELDQFDALCAVILQRAPADVHITDSAAELLLKQARLNDADLIKFYGPHFLAEPGIHSLLWDPRIDPYESWAQTARLLRTRLLKARGRFEPFSIALNHLGKTQVTTGPATKDCLSWAIVLPDKILVNYENNGERVY